MLTFQNSTRNMFCFHTRNTVLENISSCSCVIFFIIRSGNSCSFAPYIHTVHTYILTYKYIYIYYIYIYTTCTCTHVLHKYTYSTYMHTFMGTILLMVEMVSSLLQATSWIWWTRSCIGIIHGCCFNSSSI